MENPISAAGEFADVEAAFDRMLSASSAGKDATASEAVSKLREVLLTREAAVRAELEGKIASSTRGGDTYDAVRAGVARLASVSAALCRLAASLPTERGLDVVGVS